MTESSETRRSSRTLLYMLAAILVIGMACTGEFRRDARDFMQGFHEGLGDGGR